MTLDSAPSVRRRPHRWRTAAVLGAVILGGVALTGGAVVAVGGVLDLLSSSPDTCQQQADADFAVHARLVVPLLTGTVGPHLAADCDSGDNGGTTVVGTTAGVSHHVALHQLATRGWQRVDPTTISPAYSDTTVAYRTTIAGNTVYAVADDPLPGSAVVAGSTTTVDVWTVH